MPRNATNALLHNAKKAKKDEFYTQLADIQRELKHYREYFKGKIVYCNCDDPRKSNFFNYFFENFDVLGLKKLIISCYKEPTYTWLDIEKREKGFFFIYSGEKADKNYLIKHKSISFKGDGDFRSGESIDLLNQCDIVVTNPPFSLFREHVNQIVKYGKKFLVIGNINAITYKEIFQLIKMNKAWLGINLGRGVSGFIVPDHYDLYGTEVRIDNNGDKIVSPNNCLWLTNMDNFKRNEYIELTKSYINSKAEYPQYDNYRGINVNKTKHIPFDYNGVMGVPITFLHKYNPNQFEIIKFRKGDDDKDLSVNGKCTYFRVLIKRKQCDTDATNNKNKQRTAPRGRLVPLYLH